MDDGSGIKRFRDDKAKTMHDVITEGKAVDKYNFTDIHKQLITPMEALKIKNEIILNNLRGIEQLYPDLINQTQMRTLQSSPLEFRINSARGDQKAKAIQDSVQEHASKTNTLLFFYKGVNLLLDFLIDDYNRIKTEYNDLRNRNLSLMEENKNLLIEIEKYKLPEEDLEIDEVNSELVYTSEEIAQYIDKIDGEEVENNYEGIKGDTDEKTKDEPEIVTPTPKPKPKKIIRKVIETFKPKQTENNVDFDDIANEFNAMDERKKK